jgi:hypothetical protein
MKNLIAILAILLVALAQVALAEETGNATSGETDKSPREKAKDRMEDAKDRITDARTEVRGAKSEVREARKALRLETREEIKTLRDQVKAACEADKTSEACKNARMDAREGKHTLLGRIASKMGPTFKRAEQLEKRLTQIVERLAKKGKDTSGLDTGAIKAKIAEAQALFNEGKKLFEDARAAEAGAKDELMKQAAQKFRDANKTLKDARALIIDWLKSVKQKDPKAVEETSSTTETAPAESNEAPAADTNATSATNVTSSTDDDDSEDADEGNTSSQVNASTNETAA